MTGSLHATAGGVAFITSIRHPRNATDFNRVLALFETMARSVCAQSDPRFQLIVVCNEKPDIGFEHPSIIYHEVDFPPPSLERTASISLSATKRDKGAKLVCGMLLAQRFKPAHVYLIDADDWLNRHMVACLLEGPSHPVQYVTKGYMANSDTRTVRQVHGLTRYNGSTVIYSNALALQLIGNHPELDENTPITQLTDTLDQEFLFELVGDHIEFYRIMLRRGHQPQPLPLHGVCWVVGTGENQSATQASGDGLALSAELCEEFGLGPEFVNSQPASLRMQLFDALAFCKSWCTWWLTRVTGRNVYW